MTGVTVFGVTVGCVLETVVAVVLDVVGGVVSECVMVVGVGMGALVVVEVVGFHFGISALDKLSDSFSCFAIAVRWFREVWEVHPWRDSPSFPGWLVRLLLDAPVVPVQL